MLTFIVGDHSSRRLWRCQEPLELRSCGCGHGGEGRRVLGGECLPCRQEAHWRLLHRSCDPGAHDPWSESHFRPGAGERGVSLCRCLQGGDADGSDAWTLWCMNGQSVWFAGYGCLRWCWESCGDDAGVHAQQSDSCCARWNQQDGGGSVEDDFVCLSVYTTSSYQGILWMGQCEWKQGWTMEQMNRKRE